MIFIFLVTGVRRRPEEMEDGEVDVLSTFGPYNICAVRYSDEDFDKLAKLSQYNIQNNKDLIIKALRIAVDRKKKFKNN